MAASKQPKGNGNTSFTGPDRNGTSMTVTNDPSGKPMSYTKWNTYTGRVTSSGKFPLKGSGK